MIVQWLFQGALQLVGIVFAVQLGGRGVDRTTQMLVAYPLGLLAWVIASLMVLLSPLPFTGEITIAVMMGLTIVALICIVARKDDLPAFSGRTLLVGVVVFNLVSFLIHQVNLTTVSNDSFYILIFAHEIGHFGQFTELTGQQLAGWGAFAPISQVASEFMNEGYLFGTSPLLGAITLALLFHWTMRGLKVLQGVRLIAVTIAVLSVTLVASTPAFQRHMTYIHTNLGAAAYLLIYVGAAWMRFSTGDRGWLAIAVAGLIGFSLHRVEAPLVAAIFLAPIAESNEIRPREKLTATLLIAVFLTAWFAVVAQLIGDHESTISRANIPIMLIPAWALVAVATASFVRRFRFLLPWTTVIMTWALLLIVVAFFVIKPQHMEKSFDNLTWNLTWKGAWHATFITLFVLLLWTPFLRRIPGEPLFRAAIPAFFLLVIALGALRRPYRLDFFDSGNRMALHILPALVFYLAIKYGNQLRANPPSIADAKERTV